jgi:putative transposase
VTGTFRVLYVFVVIEHHSRRLVHCNVTAHPTAQWTRQQLRDAVGCEERYRYLLHDRDAIFSAELDESIQRLGLRVLKSPPHSPKSNALCERVIGTLRRECLDWLIPLSEAHLRQTLKSWVAHYNGGRPHSRSVRASLIFLRIRLCRCRPRVIGSTTSARFMPNQYSVDCITSIR